MTDAVPRLRGYLPLWVLSLAAFVVYSVTALLIHRRFGTAGYDLGIFDQAVRRYAHLQAPMVPLKGPGYNIFGDHFHPIIALAAPLYWLFDDPRTLLVLQAGLIAVSVLVVFAFARRRTTDRVSLAIAFGYAFSWAFQTMVNFDFHEVAWGVPILALAIDALDRDDDRALLGWAAALLLVREDMGVLVLVIGVLRIFRGRPPLREWRPGRWPARVRQLSAPAGRAAVRRIGPGIALILGGVAAYEITTGLILPHFSPTGTFAYWQYGSTLGPSLGAAAVGAVTRPWHLVHLFFVPWVKFRTLLLMLVPLALLPLRSRYAWLALPLLAQRFFEPAERYRLWQPAYHYNALPWVILTLAMVDGAARFRLHSRRPSRVNAAAGPGVDGAVRPGVFGHRRWTAALCAVLVAGPILITATNRNVAVLHDLASGRLLRVTPEMRAQAAVVAHIPSDVCVEADDRLAGHLTARDFVSIPGLFGYRSDFIAIDLSQKTVGGNNGPPPGSAVAETVRRGYHLVFSQGTVELWQSPDYAGPSDRCGPLGSGPR